MRSRWAPVEMPVWVCTLVLGVCLIVSRVIGIERVGKPVVFSYSSADLPHPATISHHYRPPPDQRAPLLPHQLLNGNAQESNGAPEHRKHVDQVNLDHNGPNHLPSTVAYYDDDRPTENYHFPPPAVASPSHGDSSGDHDYSTKGLEHNDPTATVVNFDGRPSENLYHHPPSTSSLSAYDERQSLDYDYSTISPRHTSSTLPYYDHPQGYDYTIVGHDRNYPSPTVAYYDDARPSDEPHHATYASPAPPQYDDNNPDYVYSTNSAPYNGAVQDGNGQYHSDDYAEYNSTPSPSGLRFTPESDVGNSSVPGATHSESYPPVNQRYSEYPNSGENLEYVHQHPTPPQNPIYTSRPPKGRRILTSTPNYYDESIDEYVSTTPIVEFESVKKKRPPVQDYPPPNPGYITKPLKTIFSNQQISGKLKNEQNAADKNGVYQNSGKVLQQPKFFAYSSDLEGEPVDNGLAHKIDGDDAMADGLHNENDDHDYKKKVEEYVKGGGQEHHSVHKASAGDKGEKGYESSHKHSKGHKGHHDKEDHKGKYLDEKGKKAKKKEEGGHYGEHHHAEKGKKSAKYGESGEHKKGHSTKGEHNIHKKDEYMKKHEFYDEHHEGGDHEKYGGFMEAHAHKKGGKKKKGHHKSGHHHQQKGKKGNHEKGEKSGHHKGHKEAKGYDGHFSHHKKYGKKGGHHEGKKWGYSKGHPK